MSRTTTKTEPELDPEEAARHRIMQATHTFCAQGLVLFDGDAQLELLFRRIATRMRYTLLVGEDPGQAEVRDRVIEALEGRRARLALLRA